MDAVTQVFYNLQVTITEKVTLFIEKEFPRSIFVFSDNLDEARQFARLLEVDIDKKIHGNNYTVIAAASLRYAIEERCKLLITRCPVIDNHIVNSAVSPLCELSVSDLTEVLESVPLKISTPISLYIRSTAPNIICIKSDINDETIAFLDAFKDILSKKYPSHTCRILGITNGMFVTLETSTVIHLSDTSSTSTD